MPRAAQVGVKSALLRSAGAPLPHPDHGLLTYGVAELPGQHHDLPAVVAIVDHVVREIAGSVVREPHDAPSFRDRRTDDAEHGLALRAEGARGLRGGDAGAVELVRNAGFGIGALEVAQPAV